MAIASKQALKTGEKEILKTIEAVPKPLAATRQVSHPPEHVIENLAEHSKKTSESTKKTCASAELDCRIANNSYLPSMEIHRKFGEMLARSFPKLSASS